MIEQITELLTMNLGSPEAAEVWLDTFHYGYDRTPREIIEDGDGDKILAYLEDLFAIPSE